MMRKTIMLLSVALTALLFAAGCAQGAEPVAPHSSDDLSTVEPQPEGEEEGSDTTELDTGEVPEAIFAAILTDLSAWSSFGVEDISVVKAESVVWPDGSLGCPELDMMYTMATVNGYHVVLETPDGLVDYRASENGNVRLCDNPPFAPAVPLDTGPPIE